MIRIFFLSILWTSFLLGMSKDENRDNFILKIKHEKFLKKFCKNNDISDSLSSKYPSLKNLYVTNIYDTRKVEFLDLLGIDLSLEFRKNKDNFSCLTNFTNLTLLDCQLVYLNEESLENIATCENIKHLVLGRVFLDKKIKIFHPLKKLKTLGLRLYDLNKHVGYLNKFANLEDLYLMYCFWSEDSLHALTEKLPNLKNIIIYNRGHLNKMTKKKIGNANVFIKTFSIDGPVYR